VWSTGHDVSHYAVPFSPLLSRPSQTQIFSSASYFRKHLSHDPPSSCEAKLCSNTIYVGYSESKHRLRISLAHPRDCHFTHVQ